jgi:minor extracellular protease Epr
LIPPVIRAAIEDLDPLEILVIGGTSVVDESVATALTTIAPVKRVAGSDRYATAVEVSRA